MRKSIAIQLIHGESLDSVISAAALTRLIKNADNRVSLLNPIVCAATDCKTIKKRIDTALICGFIPNIVGLPIESEVFRRITALCTEKEFNMPIYWNNLTAAQNFNGTPMSVVTNSSLLSAVRATIDFRCLDTAQSSLASQIDSELEYVGKYIKNADTEIIKKLNVLIPIFDNGGVFRMLLNNMRKLSDLISVSAVSNYLKVQDERISRSLKNMITIDDKTHREHIGVMRDKLLWKGDIENITLKYLVPTNNSDGLIVLKLTGNNKVSELEIRGSFSREIGASIKNIYGTSAFVIEEQKEINHIILNAQTKSLLNTKKFYEKILNPAINDYFNSKETLQNIYAEYAY